MFTDKTMLSSTQPFLTDVNHSGQQEAPVATIPLHLCQWVQHVITPEQATAWLRSSRPGNEVRTTQMTINIYAGAMRQGRWHYTGEPIIFGDDGLILNGHNRLHACVKAGVPFVSDVSFGRPHTSFAYFDIGKKRSLYHIAALAGIPEAKASSSAYKWLHRIENNQMNSSGFNRSFPDYILCEMYAKHPYLPDHVRLVPRKTGNCLTPAVSTFIHYWLSSIDAEATEKFFSSLASGSQLNDRDPILILRNKLMKKFKMPRRNDRDNLLDIVLTIKAWNAWRKGKKVAGLTWNPATENFPAPI